MRKIHRLARTDLPNVPDEIFTGFVEPLSNADWNHFDKTEEGRWYYHFGGLSIEEFNNLRWEVSPIVIRSTSFHPESKLDIYRLIDYCTSGDTIETRTRFIGYPTDSREKLIWHIKFIMDTGKLCTPIVTVRTREGLRILDGTHRVSAAIITKVPSIDAWVGEQA